MPPKMPNRFPQGSGKLLPLLGAEKISRCRKIPKKPRPSIAPKEEIEPEELLAGAVATTEALSGGPLPPARRKAPVKK